MLRIMVASNRFAFLLAYFVVWGISSELIRTAEAQASRTWTGNTGAAWLTGTNWSPSGTFAGSAPLVSLAAEGLATDIMTVATTNAATNIGINMNSLAAGGGVGLIFGGIDFNKTNTNNLQIGNSSTTVNGILQLNGATINTVAKTLIRVGGSADLTIANVNSGTGAQTMGLRLGITDGIFDVSSNRTLTISSTISENAANSGFVKTGAGTLVVNATNTFSGPSTINGGVVSISSGFNLGATPLALSPSHLTLNGGTLRLTGSGSLTLSSFRGIAIGSSNGTIDVVQSDRTLTNLGVIAGAGNSLTKDGAGVLVLSGANTYSGSTTISNGTLSLSNSGSLSDDTAVNVGSSTSTFNISAITASSEIIGSLAGTAGSSVVLGSKELIAGGNNGSTTFAGVISGVGGNFTKTGTGTMTMSGNNTYTGTTTVDAGTLVVIGNQSAATGNVTIESSATLAGNGTIGGATTFDGGSFHAPGTSPGLQTFAANLSYSANSTFVWELLEDTVSGRGTIFDGVDGTAAGTLSISSSANSQLVFNGNSTVDWNDTLWDSDQSWLVFSGFGTLSGTGLFNISSISNDSNNLPFSVTGGAFSWSSIGSDVYLNYTITAVPEPASLGGAVVLFSSWLIRRRFAVRDRIPDSSS